MLISRSIRLTLVNWQPSASSYTPMSLLNPRADQSVSSGEVMAAVEAAGPASRAEAKLD
jgi:hypothetical protein